jgi:F-type H+-transporting ATPase subunit b
MDFLTTPLEAGPIRIVAWEVLYIIVLVQVLSVILDRWLFRPVMGVLDERKRRLEAASAAREQALRALEDRARQHAEGIATARRDALSVLEAARAEAEQARKVQVDEARRTAEGRVAIAQEAVAKSMKKAEHELKLGALQLGRKIASTMLGREVA